MASEVSGKLPQQFVETYNIRAQQFHTIYGMGGKDVPLESGIWISIDKRRCIRNILAEKQELPVRHAAEVAAHSDSSMENNKYRVIGK